jgi:hypothetical protein
MLVDSCCCQQTPTELPDLMKIFTSYELFSGSVVFILPFAHHNEVVAKVFKPAFIS